MVMLIVADNTCQHKMTFKIFCLQTVSEAIVCVFCTGKCSILYGHDHMRGVQILYNGNHYSVSGH